jgi:EAL domain-containing protein (putative c-di-GMP-specific phosphodiesterase class I)
VGPSTATFINYLKKGLEASILATAVIFESVTSRMKEPTPQEGFDFKPATFGRRKVRPRACIADGKAHIRAFLEEALEELGFVTCECAEIEALDAILNDWLPDLIVLGLSAGGAAASGVLKALAASDFKGTVLPVGNDSPPQEKALHELGEQLGISILPMLSTPFGIGGLRVSLTALLPTEPVQNPPIDVAEALDAGWLEVWYQPKITTQVLGFSGAEALIRVRHPTWGVVSPAYFLPDDNDPQFRELSKFVITQVVNDWHAFVSERGHVEIGINLPIAFLRNPDCIRFICQQLPDHPAFEGLIIEINATDLIHDLDLAKQIAKQVRFHNIAISIDDLGTEWPSLSGLHDFPFAELKVDREFVAGCSEDRLKRYVCRCILDLADGYGVRTVAVGVETRADFQCVRDMGFDLVQGFLFAKPMVRKRFVRTLTTPLDTSNR